MPPQSEKNTMPPQLKVKLDLNIYTPACLADTGKDWAGLLILMIMILIFLIIILILMIMIMNFMIMIMNLMIMIMIEARLGGCMDGETPRVEMRQVSKP